MEKEEDAQTKKEEAEEKSTVQVIVSGAEFPSLLMLCF